MWHEARRQEKKIRGMMVDLRKRAERRREFYEKIKLDPTQFLRLAGRHVRINLDPAVAMVAEGPQSMQPWQGNSEIMIDRFDARSHLDHIAENTSTKQSLSASELEEERQCNYERYRILVQNDCIGVTEGQCLQQIRNDELFGADTSLEVTSETQKKKALAEKKAAIAYSYDDDGGGSEGGVPEKGKKGTKEKKEVASEAFDGLDSSDEEEIDLDIALDLEKLTNDQIQMLNSTATHFGMKAGDYFESLYNDKKEAEEIRLARLVEEEKAQFTGRRSRRERRAYKDKALVGKVNSPPSYAARKSPEYESYKRSPSRSRSRSHTPPAVTTFITSFGAESSDEEGAPRLVQGPALPPHLLPSNNTPSDSSQGRSSTKLGTSTRNGRHESRHNSCSDRSSPSRSRRSRSRSRSRHRSRRSPSPRYRSRDQYRRSRSRSHNQYRRSRSPRNRRYRSRSRSRNRYNRRSWSRHRSRSPVRSRYRSRSPRWSRSPRRSHSYRSGSPRRSKSPRQSRSPRRSRNRSRSPHRSRQDSFTRRSPAHKSRSRSSRSRSSRSSSSSSYSSKSSYSSRSSSRSRSGSPVIASAPPIKRYRRPSLSSNPTSSDDENDVDKRPSPTPSASTKSNSAVPPVGKRQAESKVTGRMSLQERMKRKMQMALSKNYKADKQAERQKYDKIEQDRMDREEELRFMSIQMRRREREKRHRFEEEDEERIQQVEKMREMERDRERDDTRRRRDKGSPERSRERHHSPGKRHRRSHSHSREYRHRRERSRERVAGPKLVDY